jgi:hypothetical protein
MRPDLHTSILRPAMQPIPTIGSCYPLDILLSLVTQLASTLDLRSRSLGNRLAPPQCVTDQITKYLPDMVAIQVETCVYELNHPHGRFK